MTLAFALGILPKPNATKLGAVWIRNAPTPRFSPSEVYGRAARPAGWAYIASQGLAKGFLLLACGSGQGLLPLAEMTLLEKPAAVFSFLKLLGISILN